MVGRGRLGLVEVLVKGLLASGLVSKRGGFWGGWFGLVGRGLYRCG